MVTTNSSVLQLQWEDSTDVDPVEVIGSEGGIALGALTLPGVIACFHTLKAEDMKTLCEDSILFAHVTAWAGQAGLQDRIIIERAHCIALHTLKHD